MESRRRIAGPTRRKGGRRDVLEEEYEALATGLGFTWDEIQMLNRNALAAAWCSDEEKRRLAALVGGCEA